MANIVHSNLVSPEAIHPAAYVGSTDPGTVGAHKFWVDTTSGPPFTLKKRNAANAAWEVVGQAGTSGTFTGEVQGTDFKPTGLTGSVSASRYVGATVSGPPLTGAHVVGDWSIDQTGRIWFCTVAATPGTFVPLLPNGTRVRLSTTLSIPSGAYTLVNTWDTEDADIDGQHFTSALALTGTVAKAASTVLTGTSTLFTTELTVGQMISVPGGASTEVRVIATITSDTLASVSTAFTTTASGQTATRANSGLVITRAGFYSVEAGSYWPTGTGSVGMQFRLNGSTIIAASGINLNAEDGVFLYTQRQFALYDYVELLVKQTNASAAAVLLQNDERTHFSIKL